MAARADAPSAEAARAFLAALAASPDAPVETHVMLVVAHPDDETIVLGAQMPRLPRLEIVTVTDGAPADLRDAAAQGFATREAYAQARRREQAAAVALAGIREEALGHLGFRDQTCAHRLADLCAALAALVAARAPEIVVTHALEGGHPDHDAVAFAVRAARLLAMRGGARAPEIVEAPLYRLDGETRVFQSFAPGSGAGETVLDLDERRRDLKRRMLAAHATQAAVTTPFCLRVERLRPAEPVDVDALPNDGALLYERRPWGLDGRTWCAAVSAARAALELPPRL
ncbi:PIG-L deacetylase family protein [Salinarimonas chemoclinalis]|uniref:PIG-L deacetylase family protein n=1 Tax=Salinarimonas chemoclinalis TaxID=3241599 RepID=UPI003557B4F2